MADSEGVSNLNPEAPQAAQDAGLSLSLTGLLAGVDKLVSGGLSAAEAGEKLAQWVDPSLVPALNTLIDVLTEAKNVLDKV